MNIKAAAVVAALALLAVPACNRPERIPGTSAPTTTEAKEEKSRFNEGSPSLLLDGELEITGAAEGKSEAVGSTKTMSIELGTTCSELAENGMGEKEGPHFQMPGMDAEIDGKWTLVWLFIKPYEGPGSYDKDDYPPFDFLSTKDKVAGIVVDRLGEDPRTYEPVEDSTMTARIDADGSGELEFEDLQEEQDARKISGSIKWDCLDPDPAEVESGGTPSPGDSPTRGPSPTPSPS